jgi:hypothetical protein
MIESTCNGCGKNIVWGKTKDGKRIPLDSRAPVYLQSDQYGNGSGLAFRQEEVEHYIDPLDGSPGCDPVKGKWMVSHFATCPKANEFSASKKS